MGFGDGVKMIRRGDGHGVDALAHLVEHDAEIPVKFRLRIFLDLFRAIHAVHVAQGDDVFAAATIRVDHALAPRADGGNVQLAVQIACAQQGRDTEHHGAAGQGGGFEKVATPPTRGLVVTGRFH